MTPPRMSCRTYADRPGGNPRSIETETPSVYASRHKVGFFGNSVSSSGHLASLLASRIEIINNGCPCMRAQSCTHQILRALGKHRKWRSSACNEHLAACLDASTPGRAVGRGLWGPRPTVGAAMLRRELQRSPKAPEIVVQ